MLVIYSFIDFVSPPKKEPDNLFEERKTDHRPHKRANHAHCTRNSSRKPQEIHRFDLNDLRRYCYPAFFAVLLIHKPQIQPDRPAVGPRILRKDTPVKRG